MKNQQVCGMSKAIKILAVLKMLIKSFKHMLGRKEIITSADKTIRYIFLKSIIFKSMYR